MSTEEMIKVMQAYKDGKQIEVALMGKNKGYQPLRDEIWDFINYHYRVKPEPKHRPLKPEELIELKGKWLKHKKFESIHMVIGIDVNKKYVKLFELWWSIDELYDSWTYEDGTPVGKLE